MLNLAFIKGMEEAKKFLTLWNSGSGQGGFDLGLDHACASISSKSSLRSHKVAISSTFFLEICKGENQT
jgi:hypothetical protein